MDDIDELPEQIDEIKHDYLRSQKIMEQINLRRNKKIKKYEAFCVAIKGNDKRCANYARKNCDEGLCHSHRSLATGYIDEPKKYIKNLIEGSEKKCWKPGCGHISQYVIYQGSKTKYCCWMHTN